MPKLGWSNAFIEDVIWVQRTPIKCKGFTFDFKAH